MLDLISADQLRRLSQQRDSTPHVSIYMPTIKAGDETRQNPTRFKNLLRNVRKQLEATDMAEAEIDSLLGPALRLQSDYPFWQHQAEGLALFVSLAGLESYRLPVQFDELAVVEYRFHLKPLFPFLSGDGQFYILALSQNQVRLLQGSRYTITEVNLTDIPQSLADALGYDLTEQHLQFHMGSGSPGTPIYHGQGADEDDVKQEIQQFFLLLDKGLNELLRETRVPLVLAGVEYLLPIYRSATSYAHIVPGGVTGNPNGLRPEDLHAKAWPLVEPLFAEHEYQARQKVAQQLGMGRGSIQLMDILPATVDGRVDTLFVARGVRQWGTFNSETRKVEIDSESTLDNEDLLDLAAVQTYLQKGTIFVVDGADVPGDGWIAAAYRW